MKIFFPIVGWMIIKLLMMGDSITVGFPYDPGFRAYVRDYQTVGSQPGGHEGHGGWRASGGPEGGILAHAARWTEKYDPHIVFILAGANDILAGEEDPQAFQGIVESICQANPDTRILVGTLPLIRGYEEQVKIFNSDLRKLMDDKATIVELETLLDPEMDYFKDGLHPNEHGYQLIGQALNDALQSASRDLLK